MNQVLELSPAVATAADVTHAALAVSQTTYQGGFVYKGEVKTGHQLREGSTANPWETAWIVWDYIDNDHFYYLALKTNGWELGKRDPNYEGGQRFLATGEDQVFSLGEWYRFDISRVGDTMTIRVNGRDLTTFVDHEKPYSGGRLGIYTEDACIQLDNVSGTVFDDFQMYKQQGLADGMLLGDTWNIVYLGYGFGNIAGVDTVGMIQDVVAGVPVLQLPSTTAIESKAWLNEVYGSRKGDKLVGTSENDLIDGGSGGDSMRGGLGDDSYRVDSLQDKIIEKSGEGVDTVFVSLSRYTAPLSVENLTSTNVAGSQLVGNELDNILKGSSGSDILDGLAGADILFGGGGKDIFVLRAGEANGDRIMDFQSGDQIKLVGFGEDALLVGDAQGNWAVHWDGGNEVFQVLGWGTLSSQVDYVFW